MIANPILLISLISGLIMVGAIWVLIADSRSRAHRVRVASVLSAYAPAIVTYEPAAGQTLGQRIMQAPAVLWVMGFLKIQPTRPDLYPAPWPVICAAMLIVAIVICGSASLMVSPLTWGGLPVVWILLMRWIFAHFLRRRAQILYNQFPDALAMIVRSIRAGLPVPEALRVVAEEGQMPTTLEFARLYDELRLGGSLPDALTKLARRTALLEYKFFAVSLSLQSQSGGSLTETLDNLGDVIRKRVALKARAIALASEARMTMYVLASLPFITFAGLMVVSPGYVAQLIYTSSGRVLLFIGLGLLTAGLGSMKYLIRKAVT